MAIDSGPKRRSIAGIGLHVTPSVTPDADQDAAWRRSVGWGYYGDLGASSGVILSPVARFTGPALDGSLFGKALRE